ncbi:MAG: hypothetical protein K2L05_07595 [Muribaculaceae bacterium]|nr:hypothetical protein [Muribaculaceae bacterium]
MKKFLLFAAAALIAATAFAQDEAPLEDYMKTPTIIKGGKLTPEVINNNKVILPSNLTYTIDPDSEFTFYYPDGSWFADWRKSSLPSIFPDAKRYEIDGREVTREEFYADSTPQFAVVTGAGDKLSAETLKNVNRPNPLFSQMTNASAKWYKSTFGTKPLPADLVINDPTTLPANGFLNLDYVMTTIEGLEKRGLPEGAIEGYMITLFGEYPEMNLLTDSKNLNYWENGHQIPATEVKSLRVGDIAAALNIDPARIRMIKFNGTTISVIPLPDQFVVGEAD